MSLDHYDEKYTKPDLRRDIKAEIKQSDQGGKPGQWSARKSQRLVQEYEKRGGAYKQDSKDEAAQSLEEWGEQDWQTQEGKGRARHGQETQRYLPKAVWDQLTDAEKQEAERTKQAASRQGDQHVDWTPAIKRAMQKVGHEPDGEPTKQDLYEQAQELGISGRSKMSKEELQEAIAQSEAQQSENQPENQSKADLYEKAQELNISGRSKMSKDKLADAIQEAKD